MTTLLNPDSQTNAEIHKSSAVGVESSINGQYRSEPQMDAAVDLSPESQAVGEIHKSGALGAEPVYDLGPYETLKTWAEMFHDTQESRKRLENRVRSAQVFDIFTYEIEAARQTEDRIGLALRRQYRKTVPAGVRAWEKQSTGIGEHLVARLIGHLRHPRIATPAHWEGTGENRTLIADQPHWRSVGQLWQYCGHGAPGRPQKGMTADDLAALGNPSLKTLVHLLAECAIKEPGRRIADLLAQQPIQGTDSTVEPAAGDPQPIECPNPKGSAAGGELSDDPNECPQPKQRPGRLNGTATPNRGPDSKSAAVWPYRLVYEQRRIATLGRVHADPCVRCGPAGKPALAGSPWSDKHAHCDALRIVGKAILRDLWIAADD